MSMLVLLLLFLLLLAVVMNYYSEITLTTPFRVVDGVECPFESTRRAFCGKITMCCAKKRLIKRV